MFILPDNIKIVDPCEKCDKGDDYCAISCIPYQRYLAMSSILSACVEVDLDEMHYAYHNYRTNNHHVYPKDKLLTFSQFIQEQMEGKNGKD